MNAQMLYVPIICFQYTVGNTDFKESWALLSRLLTCPLQVLSPVQNRRAISLIILDLDHLLFHEDPFYYLFFATNHSNLQLPVHNSSCHVEKTTRSPAVNTDAAISPLLFQSLGAHAAAPFPSLASFRAIWNKWYDTVRCQWHLIGCVTNQDLKRPYPIILLWWPQTTMAGFVFPKS